MTIPKLELIAAAKVSSLPLEAIPFMRVDALESVEAAEPAERET